MSTTEESSARLKDCVTTSDRRRHFLESGEWTGQTLAGEVTRWSDADPGSVAVIDQLGSRQRTYGELESDACRVANLLLAHGVAPGDVVSVQLPNWYEAVAIDLGVLKVGAVLNPLLPVYRLHELNSVLDIAQSKVLFTPRNYRGFDYVAMAEKVMANHAVLHVVVEDPADTDEGFFGPWFAHLDASAPPVVPVASDVSELIFSSGTEAAPKAIMHTEQTANAAVRKAASELGLGAGDRVWMPSPIGHSTGLNYGVRVALLNGLTLALTDKWDPEESVELLLLTRCTYTVAATTFLADVLAVAKARGVDLGFMRLFSCGGAPVPPATVAEAHDLGIMVLRLYGSTEVLIGSWNRPGSPLDKRMNTDGSPFAGVELETRDAAGKSVIGTAGELYVRSATTSVGFFDDDARTQATFGADGWVKTGDIGVLDDDGYFTMIGRSKEIIIRGGLNVAPREVEDLIRLMPSVKDVAVVPLPDPRLGEIGGACIVAAGTRPPQLSDVVAHLRESGLATFKWPEALEIFDELPRTSTGKVQKFELTRAIAERRRSSSGPEDVDRTV